MRPVLVVLGILGACGSGEAPPMLEAPVAHQIPSLSDSDQTDLSHCLLSMNTSDRRAQKEAVLRVRGYGIKALPILLSGLEIGSAQTREGCREALVGLAEGHTILKEGKVANRKIVEAWVLYEMGRGYDNLIDSISLGKRQVDPLVARSTYRQFLCLVFETVGTPEGVSVLFEAARSDKNELVRCAAYQAVGRGGSRSLVPALVRHYGEETGQARDSLWMALRTLTGKNYPDDPAVWEHWLKSGGT